MSLSKRELFIRRKMRVRSRLRKTAADRLRMSVHRSSKNIWVQIIDDKEGRTLVSASSLEPSLGVVGHNNKEAAAKVGATLAERAREKGIADVYFDRGGFIYHGKVRALADAAREGGLNF